MASLTKELREYREALVRRHMEAENILDFDEAIDTFTHPRYELIGTGQVFEGEEQVRKYFKVSRAPFPDQRNELIELHHADDAVIVEFWLMGTHLGKLGDLEPTGRTYKCRMTSFFIFEGKDLVCERVYFDASTIRDQLTG